MDAFAFTCPYCQTELEIPDNEWYYNCSQCGQRLNLESQFAFLRGLDAFAEGQEMIDKISPKQRRDPLNPRDKQAMDLFMEAYSSIQIAFRAELAEVQRSVGVEMMASMAGEFMKRSMVSPLEMNYWSTHLIIQNSQTEFDQLKQKLSRKEGLLVFIKHMRWRARQKRLLESMVELERKLASIEKQINFVDIPKAKNKSWKP
ncbi:MAG: hypothetical protein IH586_10485 [Anaerolineaceae bacterium]|nr:hypothetical protein [Anaerolineaceae bacterium]